MSNENSTGLKVFSPKDAIKDIPTHKRKTSIDISRKGSIIKEKCAQLTQIALELYPDRRIPEEDLAYLLRRYCGADKETVRAYLGYFGSIRRSKHGGEGYVVGTTRKGYLELFGFMHRVNRGAWLIHAQTTLENRQITSHTNESLEVQKQSIEKISLSNNPFPQGERGEGENRFEKVCPSNREAERETNNNNNTTERERNLSIQEEAARILNAKPLPSEPDKAKVRMPHENF